MGADNRVQCDDLPFESTPACTQVFQVELMTNGPIEVGFTVYEDFLAYQSGVYYHVSGRSHGGHAVKMVGWGHDDESNMDYWLIANSWNNDWAEEGFFRIRRGTNECGIEAGGYAGNMAGWGN